MISTKTQPINGQLRNPFGSSQSVYAGLSSSFSQFRNNLQSQLHILKRKFPQQDSQKIKDLLEEFDNNIQMVTQILSSSQQKHQMVCQKPVSRKVEADDEVRILKNAVARLYKKLIQQQKDMQALKIVNQKSKKQNQDLKLQNRLLLQRQFGNNSFEEERQVF